MKTVRNSYNYKPNSGKKPTGKSMTVQNDTETVAQMLNRHILGMPVREKAGVYLEDEDIDGQQYQQLDIYDQEMIRKRVQAIGEDLEDQLRQYKLELKEAKKLRIEARKAAKKESGT